MRNFKKILTLVLAIVMVVGCLAIGAGAAYTDDAAITYDDAVSTLTALGVFEGSDGAFNPKANLTRQEVAKIVTVLLTGGNFDPALYEDAKIFTDVDGLWGEGYINYLAGAGIASGHAGKYNPQAPVTAQELAKFMLVALGYPAELFTGDTWADNINRIASTVQTGNTNAIVTATLYKDYVGTFNKALTREEAALIMYNALTANMVQAQWSSNISNLGGWNWEWKSIAQNGYNPLTLVEKYFDCTGNLGFVTATANEYAELTGTEVVVTYGGTIDTKTTYDLYATVGASAVASYEGALKDAVTVYTNNKTSAVVAVGARTIETDYVAPVASFTSTAKIATAPAAKAALTGAGFVGALAASSTNQTAVVNATDNGLKVEFKQIPDGEGYAADQVKDGFTLIGAKAGGYWIGAKTTAGIAPYQVTADVAATYTLTTFDTDTTATDSYTIYKDAAKEDDGVFYKYDTLVKDQWYTVSTPTFKTGVNTPVALKYGKATPVVTITPVTKITGVASSYTANTVTVDGTPYALSYRAAMLDSGFASKGKIASAADIYDASNANAAKKIFGVDMFVDAYGYVFAAVNSTGATIVKDYAYIMGADVVITGEGIFKTMAAKVQVLTDDNVYGVYTLNMEIKDNDYYSGPIKLADVADPANASTDIAAIKATLVGQAFPYTVADGTLTLAGTALKKGCAAAAYTVAAGKVAPSTISLDNGAGTLDPVGNISTANYILNSATELVYMDIKGGADAAKSTATSVGTAQAVTIDNNDVVFVEFDAYNASLITKIIVLQTYTNAVADSFVFVDASSYIVVKDFTSGKFHVTYATIAADGTPGTVTCIEDDATPDIVADAIKVLNKDGTLAADDDSIGAATVTAITGDVLTLNVSDAVTGLSTGSGQMAVVASGVTPVIVAAGEVFEPTATIMFTINDTTGAINGIWVTA